MRASHFSLWERLRELLAEGGLDISTTVRVYLFPDGPKAETGVVLADGGRIYEFDLVCRAMAPGEARRAVKAQRQPAWLSWAFLIRRRVLDRIWHHS